MTKHKAFNNLDEQAVLYVNVLAVEEDSERCLESFKTTNIEAMSEAERLAEEWEEERNLDGGSVSLDEFIEVSISHMPEKVS